MTTTCQTIVSRAQGFSPLNSALTNDNAEMLTRIRSEQQALFDGLCGDIAGRFQASQTLTSTSAASGRTIDLSTLSKPLSRLLRLALPTGARVRQVDVQDQHGTHAPRYYLQELTAVEVSNDWSSVTGTVAVTVVYAYGPTDIDPTAAVTQTITLPDVWADLLILPLAFYLFTKDPGRNPQEGVEIQTTLSERRAAFSRFLARAGGDAMHPGASA